MRGNIPVYGFTIVLLIVAIFAAHIYYGKWISEKAITDEAESLESVRKVFEREGIVFNVERLKKTVESVGDQKFYKYAAYFNDDSILHSGIEINGISVTVVSGRVRCLESFVIPKEISPEAHIDAHMEEGGKVKKEFMDIAINHLNRITDGNGMNYKCDEVLLRTRSIGTLWQRVIDDIPVVDDRVFMEIELSKYVLLEFAYKGENYDVPIMMPSIGQVEACRLAKREMEKQYTRDYGKTIERKMFVEEVKYMYMRDSEQSRKSNIKKLVPVYCFKDTLVNNTMQN